MDHRQCPIVLDQTGQDIHAEAARLRANGTVVRIEMPQGVTGWSVTNNDIIKQLLLDPRISKDPRKHWPAYANGDIRSDWPLNTWVEMDNLTTRYGAEHSALRKIVARAFSPRRTEAMRPQIIKVVDELLNDLADLPVGQVVDVKRHFTYQLPVRIISDLFGVPETERSAAMRGGEIAVDTSVTPEEADANVREWLRTMSELLDYKRHTPGDDLTTDLLNAVFDDGTALSDSELIGTLFLLLSAGSETVMNLMTSAVRELLLRPDQLELVRTGQVGWSDVVEETLRVESPVAQLPIRFALEDVEIGGVTIGKGDPILIGFAAAGRDPATYGETADRFDLTRADKRHVSFGVGAHFCLGAPLARLEAGIGLPALFDRFPDMALAVAPDQLLPQVSFIMNGNVSLPVFLHGRPATEVM